MNPCLKTIVVIFLLSITHRVQAVEFEHGALTGDRYRIVISTDIGGSDPDDFQSMIHFLMYADLFDVEGIISSPWGEGRKQHILEVIDRYEQDYPKLKAHSPRYPEPDFLRSISKQGAIDISPAKGYRSSTEGFDWLVRRAKKEDPRPLYVLAWALPEDIAQALHDAPEIMEKLRVVFIGGPNKKWGTNAFDYIERNFPDIWMIENNSTYRGFFNGGDQSGDLGNLSFFENHIKGHGMLGDYFGHFRGGDIKMGDTPSLTYLFYGDPENPETESWGGRFRRVTYRPKFIFDRPTAKDDKVEVFSVVEWNFKDPDLGEGSDEVQFKVKIDGQCFDGYYIGGGVYQFRLTPKSLGEWSYTIESPHSWLNGQSGQFVSVGEGELGHREYEIEHKNWWTDSLDPALKEGEHSGAKSINRYREDILRNWQQRMDWIGDR